MNRIRGEDICHGCGKSVLFMKTMTGKTITVDPDPVYVRLDPGGEVFFTEEGIPEWGEELGEAFDTFDDPDSELATAKCYIPHKGKCPGGGRKRRARQ